MSKSGPYIVFNDLFCYADGNQNNIKEIIKHYDEIKKENKRDKLEIIKEIIDLYIGYYNPKMIVITNAYASDLIKESLSKETKGIEEDYIKYNNVDIIFSGRIGGGNMDKYSRYRLKKRINEIYNKEV